MPIAAHDREFVPLAEAARALGETPENTRLRLLRKELVGEQRGKGRRWHVEAESLARLVDLRPARASVDRRIDQLTAEMREIAAEVEHLRTRAGTAEELHTVRRERDRYRAEASTMREAAIRANAAQRAAAKGFRDVLDALDYQADALTELLGPRSPEEFGDPTGATPDRHGPVGG